MQRINTLKQSQLQGKPKPQTQSQHPTQPQPQHQQSEYHQKEIHRNVITATNDCANPMKMKSPISDSVYTVHLEFTEASTGMGEEIRDTLKEKYLQQELKSGSMQMEASALQYSSQVEETEEKGL